MEYRFPIQCDCLVQRTTDGSITRLDLDSRRIFESKQQPPESSILDWLRVSETIRYTRFHWNFLQSLADIRRIWAGWSCAAVVVSCRGQGQHRAHTRKCRGIWPRKSISTTCQKERLWACIHHSFKSNNHCIQNVIIQHRVKTAHYLAVRLPQIWHHYCAHVSRCARVSITQHIGITINVPSIWYTINLGEISHSSYCQTVVQKHADRVMQGTRAHFRSVFRMCLVPPVRTYSSLSWLDYIARSSRNRSGCSDLYTFIGGKPAWHG